MRRFLLAWVLPPVLLATVALGPVLLGLETFFLRDVFSAHLELRGALHAGLQEGGIAEWSVPAVDPYRGGGQALAANPNAVAFHPSALLHRVLPFFAAFNLHLALHLLLAPFALFWLARELGLERRPAWVAGITWGFSGFLVSQLAFYNLVGGVVATPALAAAAVRAVRRRRQGERAGGALLATGLLWAVVLVSGDPLTALAAGTAALALALVEGEGGSPGPLALRRRWGARGLVVAAFAAGTLLALPQLLPFLALLPETARGQGYEPAMRLAGSFDPRQAVEWLLPFAFGRPDQLGPGAFWGYRFHQGSWAFYFTLYPGLAALALVLAGGRAWRLAGAVGRVGRRGWVLVLAGLFFALGAFNPLVGWLMALPGLEAARFPIKLWLWVALGAALLCGVGWARLAGGDGAEAGVEAGNGERSTAPRPAPQRRFLGTLLALAVLLGLLALVLHFTPVGVGPLQAVMPPGAPREVAVLEAARWALLAGASALAALAFALLALPGRRSLLARRPGMAGALLVTLHAALQLAFLAPALATEPAAPYREAPLVARALPSEERIAHGAFDGLFGQGTMESGDLPVPEVRWVFRRAFAEAYPFFGPLLGRRYDLNASPEGLDTAGLRLAAAAVESAPDDATRLRLLESWGIGRLLLHRDLEGTAPRTAASPSPPGGGPAPPALLATPADPMEPTEPAEATGGAGVTAPPAPQPPGGSESGTAGTDEPAAPARGRAELLARLPSVERQVRVYRLPGAAPEVYLATGLVHLRAGTPPVAAAVALADPRFRPGRDAVLASPGTPTRGATPGRVEVLSRGPEHLEVATSAADPGVLVWQRAHLPGYRATVDGRPVEPRTVNLYRVGVPLPPGEHRVRVELDRSPRDLGRAGALAGALLLLGLAFAARRRRP